MIEELQNMVARLGERIDDRCGGLECRVEQLEQRAEERLVSLEMSRAEMEAGCTELEKQVDGLKLEVNRVNRFFKRETMANHQRGAGIFNPSNLVEIQGMSQTIFPSHSTESFRDLSHSR
jgi:uncharacterized coiled-coil protein SlyX